MRVTTLSMGPPLETYAPEFALRNHNNEPTQLGDLIGPRGLLLGFSGDTWDPASVRRILWLQRYHAPFEKQGVNLALVLCDQPHKLHGYSMSAVVPLTFPLLADENRDIHVLYNMERYAGLVLVDANWLLRDKWIVPDERVWPRIGDLLTSIEQL
jgi:peroxiredoxin